MSGGLRSIAARSRCGVSPVRMATRTSCGADAAQGRAEVALDVVGERLQRADVDDARDASRRAFQLPPRRRVSASRHAAGRHRRSAGRAPRGTPRASCPSPVGADSSTCSPRAIAGHACAWAGVGAAKAASNHSRTRGAKLERGVRRGSRHYPARLAPARVERPAPVRRLARTDRDRSSAVTASAQQAFPDAVALAATAPAETWRRGTPRSRSSASPERLDDAQARCLPSKATANHHEILRFSARKHPEKSSFGPTIQVSRLPGRAETAFSALRTALGSVESACSMPRAMTSTWSKPSATAPPLRSAGSRRRRSSAGEKTSDRRFGYVDHLERVGDKPARPRGDGADGTLPCRYFTSGAEHQIARLFHADARPFPIVADEQLKTVAEHPTALVDRGHRAFGATHGFPREHRAGTRQRSEIADLERRARRQRKAGDRARGLAPHSGERQHRDERTGGHPPHPKSTLPGIDVKDYGRTNGKYDDCLDMESWTGKVTGVRAREQEPNTDA